MLNISLTQKTAIRLITDAIKTRWNITVNDRQSIISQIASDSYQINHFRQMIDNCNDDTDEEVILQYEDDIATHHECISDLQLLLKVIDGNITIDDLPHVACLINNHW